MKNNKSTNTPKITIADIREYQGRMRDVRAGGFIASEFKALGRELRDEFNLTDREAINILNNNEKEILELLERQEIPKAKKVLGDV